MGPNSRAFSARISAPIFDGELAIHTASEDSFSFVRRFKPFQPHRGRRSFDVLLARDLFLICKVGWHRGHQDYNLILPISWHLA
jgi:hypothetical protein